VWLVEERAQPTIERRIERREADGIGGV